MNLTSFLKIFDEFFEGSHGTEIAEDELKRARKRARKWAAITKIDKNLFFC